MRLQPLPFGLAASLLAAMPQPALAQRAADNVATQSSDAFGRSVGNDKSGLYSSDEVRGFNPVDAGNVRLEGLYFDQVDRLSSRLSDSNTIRVGPAALRYPFPAPTGLVDYVLTQPQGDRASYSLTVDNGSNFSPGLGANFEIKQPLDGERLGIAAGAGFRNADEFEGGTARFRTVGASVGWRPKAGVSVLLFGGAFYFREDEARPTFYPAGTQPPPQVERGIDLSQSWSDRHAVNWAYGAVVKAPLGGLGLEAGLFYNGRTQDRAFADLLFGVASDGSVAARRIIADGNNRDASLSGEFRLVRQWQSGTLSHRLTGSLRGRARDRRFGGSRSIALGASTILTADPRPEPVYTIGPKSLDEVRQLTYGLSYSLVSEGRFGLDASLSQTRYRKAVDFADPLLDDPLTRDNPLMWNVAGSYSITSALSLYGGASHGMEEALVAPEAAVNRSEVPAAIHTRQIEAGIKYALTARLTLIAGGFAITKPYYNLDPGLRYRQLGTLRNRGIELSLAGQVLPGVTVVGGLLLLDPRVSGEAVDSGLIGQRPVGQVQRRAVANLDWRLDGGASPFSVDVAIEALSSRTGNAANTLVAPPRSVVNLGARYRFKAAGGNWLLRPSLLNLFDTYGWNVSGSGGFTYTNARTGMVTLVMDF